MEKKNITHWFHYQTPRQRNWMSVCGGGGGGGGGDGEEEASAGCKRVLPYLFSFWYENSL